MSEGSFCRAKRNILTPSLAHLFPSSSSSSSSIINFGDTSLKHNSKCSILVNVVFYLTINAEIYRMQIHINEIVNVQSSRVTTKVTNSNIN